MRAIFTNRPALALFAGAIVAALTASPFTNAAASDNPAVMADTTPTRVLSVVSGGYWEDSIDKPAAEKDDSETASESTETDSATDAETVKQDIRGYYRSVAIRSEDNTSRLFLQRIWLTEDGPKLLDTREIETLTEMKVYITDMRPEDSTGIAKQQGFVTFVYLKKDPASQEPDTWELFVDAFGDTAFTPASN